VPTAESVEQPVFYYDLGSPDCYLAAERIMAAARRAIRARQAGNQVIVVVSARGDTTVAERRDEA